MISVRIFKGFGAAKRAFCRPLFWVHHLPGQLYPSSGWTGGSPLKILISAKCRSNPGHPDLPVRDDPRRGRRELNGQGGCAVNGLGYLWSIRRHVDLLEEAERERLARDLRRVRKAPAWRPAPPDAVARGRASRERPKRAADRANPGAQRDASLGRLRGAVHRR